MIDDFLGYDGVIYADTDAIYFKTKQKKGKEKMKKAKYEVGDKVIVKDGSNIKNYHGGWVKAMKDFVGRVCTITHVSPYLDRYGTYGYRMKEIDCTWDERGLEKVDEVYTVTVSGRKVIVSGNGTTGEARCNPEDKFDLAKGISLAIERMDEIKEGDWVEVVEPGQAYTTYSTWISENIKDKIMIAEYRYGESVPKYLEGKVIKISKHHMMDDMLAFIKGHNGYYLIGIKGLKKVKTHGTE